MRLLTPCVRIPAISENLIVTVRVKVPVVIFILLLFHIFSALLSPIDPAPLGYASEDAQMDKRFNLNNYRPAGQRRGEGSGSGTGNANTNANVAGGSGGAGAGSRQVQQTPRTGTAKPAALINQTPRAGTGSSSAVKPRPFISPKLASRVAQAQATPGGVSQTPRATSGTATPASRAATGPLVGPGTSGTLLGSRKSPFKRFGSPSKVRVQVGNSTSSTSSHSQATMSFGTSLGKPVFGVNRQTPPNNSNMGVKQTQFSVAGAGTGASRTNTPPQAQAQASTSKASSSSTPQAQAYSPRPRELTKEQWDYLRQMPEPQRSQNWYVPQHASQYSYSLFCFHTNTSSLPA